MGFGWSSFIAQTVMTAVCRSAGLRRCIQSSDSLAAPVSDNAFGFATDDVVHFTCRGERHAAAAMDRVDRAMAQHGIDRHVGKDITGVLNGTAVRVDLCDWSWFWGNAGETALLLPAILGIVVAPVVLPRDVAIV